MEGGIGIKDIARMAGVSAATVSRVINQNGRYSRETEERVRAVIEREKYIPDVSAKGLRQNRTMVVGVIVPDITNPHFAGLVLSIEMRLFREGYSCMICNTTESGMLEKRHVESLAAQKVAGIILLSGMNDYPAISSIPVIYVDRPAAAINAAESAETAAGTEAVIIESDNEEGGYLVTKELISSGCRRIAILKSIAHDRNQSNRYHGYQRALREAGLEEDSALCVNLPEVSMQAANAEMRGLIASGSRFDAVVCTTDTLAAGAVIALREKNIRIPEDCMVTGFDDTPFAAAIGPGITSVHQDVEKMAELSTELLLRVIRGEELQEHHYLIPVSVSKRASTDPHLVR